MHTTVIARVPAEVKGYQGPLLNDQLTPWRNPEWNLYPTDAQTALSHSQTT